MRESPASHAPDPLRLTALQRDKLKVLFLAKHACAGGAFDAEDGTHAVYHHEILTVLRRLGLDVEPVDRFEDLLAETKANYLFTLYNRAGFPNSEAFASLLAEYRGLPYLGASPVLRAVSDDKHFMKVIARDLGIATPRWAIYRKASGPISEPGFKAERYVAKPNASSASWGLSISDSWQAVRAHIEHLQAAGHDVIVEEFVPGRNVAVPVITHPGPCLLPITETTVATPDNVPTYEEKRDLKAGLQTVRFADEAAWPELVPLAQRIVRALWPFDYGRIEFRIDDATGALWFIEVNLSCNLSSTKSIARSASWLGLSHGDVVETILASSLMRQNVFLDERAAGNPLAMGRGAR